MRALLALVLGLGVAVQAAPVAPFAYVDAQRCFVASQGVVRPVFALLVRAAAEKNIAPALLEAALKDAQQRGCAVNQADLDGFSPLDLAIIQGNVALVRWLLQHGADGQQQTRKTPQDPILTPRILLAQQRQQEPARAATWTAIEQLLRSAH